MALEKPIFLVGPHRSGTTLLYQLLARHAELGYFNRANKRFPNSPRLAHGSTLLDRDDRPREAQPIWDRFRTRDDDLMTAEDATPEIALWYRAQTERVLRLRRAPRFIAKYPRLSLRIDWIDAIFPGSLFVHVLRDWRAVVGSTTARSVKRERRGGGWFGVRVPGWREERDAPREIAVARTFRAVTETIEHETERRPDRFFQASYEEVCGDPAATLRRLARQLELPWTAAFEASIPSDLVSGNARWAERIDPALLARARAEAPDFFDRYEALVEARTAG